MKEIIKIERFLDSIIQNVWRNNDSKHHKTNYSLYSDFGNYPDLNDFETELLTVDRELIDDKIKNIKEKCNELIEFYDIKISNLPIGNGTVTIGKLNLNPIDLKYNEAENAASITIEVYEKIENNSKLTVLHFDDNDLINTIEKIKAIVEKTNEADNEAPEADNETPKRDLSKFDALFVTTISKNQKDSFKIDIDTFVDGYTKNQIVALAFVLHDLVHQTVRPKVFKTWLEMFCAIIGKKTPTAKQSKPEVQAEIPKMKQTYYYLFP